ncbi:bifunctional isocitrate dehydrogenase kinase/phosphatase [Pseudidiomarina gelatinasegens]|uniref:Isocitrate dehydrogenase kinase/phosphatase n=1 Tax=Pseudidiomarina gelatinasegens TaxID=2487740 RepID=A0A443YVP4_9GAMM|nr:bifunctional isocitrate dehydrogenase kinase/phosphatase [Pseudidiomarina gelatinasegens]RWU08070.1 bifunctional isocitrate dehydrogenase kinase/phosphatase [Pseudidiomarina gelatinasegens]
MSNDELAGLFARKILQGFHKHYAVFQEVTRNAKQRFAEGDWHAGQYAATVRISFYDQRVHETTTALRKLTDDKLDEQAWLATRQLYQEFLQFHPQAELAETFYNSVFCNLFHRRYFNNAYIFVETTLSNSIPLALETEFRSYFPVVQGMRRTLARIMGDVDFGADYDDLSEDIRLLRKAFRDQTEAGKLSAYQLRIDVLKEPFFRNKAAYVVGRIVSANRIFPFIVPVLRTPQGKLYLDALITNTDEMAIIFGFARSYFMVHTRAPSALVRFLKDLMPKKTLAELYSAIGLHKQSKTEFYRDFLHHLEASDDQLVAAAGIKGMVMTVFTLPSYPYVFKVIKDEFGGGKQMSRQTVIDRYRMVKRHDRAGRMADTYEFANVAIPLDRIAPDLLEELQTTVAGSLKIENGQLIISQLFVERRMVPLNIFLEYGTPAEIEKVMKDYGQAIKDMMAANIFPGDMLLKNFGLTRHKRVVFYDYDEVQYLTEMNFRTLPKAETYEQMIAPEPWYTVAPNDVFPEQLATFAVPQPELRDLLLKFHPELIDAKFWQQQQEHLRQGVITDVFPYPEAVRFMRCVRTASE